MHVTTSHSGYFAILSPRVRHLHPPTSSVTQTNASVLLLSIPALLSCPRCPLDDSRETHLNVKLSHLKLFDSSVTA